MSDDIDYCGSERGEIGWIDGAKWYAGHGEKWKRTSIFRDSRTGLVETI